jgi:hypothetical protein
MSRPRDRRRACASRWGREDGQVLPIAAAMLVMFFAIALLVIDGGALYSAQRRAQLAADAGALAGADDAANSATLTTDATSFALKNAPSSSVAVSSSSVANSDSVQDSKSVPLVLGGLFGVPSETVSASATAQLHANYAQVPDGVISPNGCVPEYWGGCEYSPGQYVGPQTSSCTALSSTNWCVVAGTVDLQPCSGGGGSCTDPNGNPIANEVVDLNGSTEGAMAETVQTIAGDRYVLSFILTGNPNGNSCAYNVFTGYVIFQPEPSGTPTTQSFTHTNSCTPGSPDQEVANFQNVSVPFVATSSQTTLAFDSTTNPPGGYAAYGPEVTNIALTYAEPVLIK